jgi:hypothetical protein
MKQYYITTENLLYDSPDDCYLSPDDPFHELKIASQLGGLGSAERLAEYNAAKAPKVQSLTESELEYKHSLQPGTEEWFKYHFSKRS